MMEIFWFVETAFVTIVLTALFAACVTAIAIMIADHYSDH
jgi:hypothetical protein